VAQAPIARVGNLADKLQGLTPTRNAARLAWLANSSIIGN
jgi:hypothetical protein